MNEFIIKIMTVYLLNNMWKRVKKLDKVKIRKDKSSGFK